MPSLQESTLIQATSTEIWGALLILPEFATEFKFVSSVEHYPEGSPMQEGSRLHVATSVLSSVIVAEIVELNHDTYSMRSHISGPLNIMGDFIVSLDGTSDNQSRLMIDGTFSCDLPQPVVNLGLSVFSRRGMPQIGDILAKKARARRDNG